MLAALLTPSRSTVTNLLCAGGSQHADWTADYRLYSRGRVDPHAPFEVILRHACGHLKAGEPVVLCIDDTMVRKTGSRIDGVRFRIDRLGPKFRPNFVLGQRYLQCSVAWTLPDGSAPLLPVDFEHAPGAGKLGTKATPEEAEQWRRDRRSENLAAKAAGLLARLRDQCPADRAVHVCGDGGYTNSTVLRNLPANCVYIGRTRKDLALCLPVARQEGPCGKGRPRKFGAPAPTPEELLKDSATPWQEVRAHAAGKYHTFKVKTLGPVLWPKGCDTRPLRIVAVAPLGYRLVKGGRLHYRDPAYILCTDPDLPVERILQDYLRRWGIEVNFRDEKTLVGVGDAQVRTRESNRRLPALLVGAYGLLRLAALRAMESGGQLDHLPAPAWRHPPASPPSLPSTGELLRILRHEVLGQGIDASIYDRFGATKPLATKWGKMPFGPPCLIGTTIQAS
jgi:hypothetical protein